MPYDTCIKVSAYLNERQPDTESAYPFQKIEVVQTRHIEDMVSFIAARDTGFRKRMIQQRKKYENTYRKKLFSSQQDVSGHRKVFYPSAQDKELERSLGMQNGGWPESWCMIIQTVGNKRESLYVEIETGMKTEDTQETLSM